MKKSHTTPTTPEPTPTRTLAKMHALQQLKKCRSILDEAVQHFEAGNPVAALKRVRELDNEYYETEGCLLCIQEVLDANIEELRQTKNEDYSIEKEIEGANEQAMRSIRAFLNKPLDPNTDLQILF